MVYKAVEAYCYKKRISIRNLERKCGFANGTIGKWKNRIPEVKSLIKLSDVTGMSINKLIKCCREDLNVLGVDEEQTPQ